jgi:Tol biopolymer transport system component
MKRSRESMSSKSILALCMFALTITACGTLEVEVEPEPTSPAVDSDVIETSEPAPPPTEVPTQEPIVPAHIASGLTLNNADGLWWVDAQGEVQLLVDQTYAQLSPDGDWIVYEAEDPETYMNDLWLLELATGERTRLTDTPDRDEVNPTWWIGRPDVIVFGSDSETGMSHSNYPSVVKLDGTGYQVLDPDRGGPFDLAPDGQRIAYGSFDQEARIYNWGEGWEVFDPGEYGLAVEKLFQPSWSPDGRYLAWKVSGDLWGNGNSQLGTAIFDLENKTAELLHVFQPVGGGMVPHNLAWSPDGEWLAITAHNEDAEMGRRPNLWILHPGHAEEIKLGEGTLPVWRYDGQYLAFGAPNAEGFLDVMLAQTGTWEITTVSDLPLPERFLFLTGWVRP